MGNVGPRSVRGWPEREVRPGHRDPAQSQTICPAQKAGDADSPPPSRSYASLPRAIRGRPLPPDPQTASEAEPKPGSGGQDAGLIHTWVIQQSPHLTPAIGNESPKALMLTLQ